MSAFRDDNGIIEEEAVRFSCLSLVYREHTPEEAVKAARILADFVLGKTDAAIIAGAKALAATVDGAMQGVRE